MHSVITNEGLQDSTVRVSGHIKELKEENGECSCVEASSIDASRVVSPSKRMISKSKRKKKCTVLHQMLHGPLLINKMNWQVWIAGKMLWNVETFL